MLSRLNRTPHASACWCSAPQAPADLQSIIDSGRGGVPLKDLKFRCAKCGSRLTDAVVMGRGGIGVQPWRHEAGRSIAPQGGRMPVPLFKQGRQPLIPFREFDTDRALRMVLRYRSGFVPPRLGSVAVISRVPVLGQRFCLSCRPVSDQIERLVQPCPAGSPLGVMDSAAELITRAARYRALAAGVTDEQTRAGLLELAKKYEALAREK